MIFDLQRSRGLALAVSLLAPSARAGEPPAAVLAPATAQRVEASSARLQETLMGRRFVAETIEVPRRESERAAGESGVRYLQGQPSALVFGPRRLQALADGELDLALVRELARAGAALPLAMPEADMAAYQAEMEYALDRCAGGIGSSAGAGRTDSLTAGAGGIGSSAGAGRTDSLTAGAGDEAFARRLRQAFRSVARQEAAARSEHERLQAKLPEGARLAEPLLPAPRGEFERIAYYILLFGRDRDEFYWAVERGLPRAAGAVRLTELEDFVERYGPDFSSARAGAAGRYVRLDGRRYAPALLQAARRLSEAGGLSRIREALGPFETVAADALQVKVNAWLRAAP